MNSLWLRFAHSKKWGWGLICQTMRLRTIARVCVCVFVYVCTQQKDLVRLILLHLLLQNCAFLSRGRVKLATREKRRNPHFVPHRDTHRYNLCLSGLSLSLYIKKQSHIHTFAPRTHRHHRPLFFDTFDWAHIAVSYLSRERNLAKVTQKW